MASPSCVSPSDEAANASALAAMTAGAVGGVSVQDPGDCGLGQLAETHDSEASWLLAQNGASVGCSHRIVRHLASGGMGHVFLVEHVFLGAQGAAKVPRFAGAAARNMLAAEAELLATLNHPNIIKVLDSGMLADGRPYMLMEHASGVELDAWLDARGSMEPDRVLRVLRQVAAAVDYLHRRGIVHGDIKPSNILVDIEANDFVKLLDFGIASRGSTGQRRGMAGTPAYMAPEQARGEAWGPASDVYAVASLAMELLTGRPAYDYVTAQDIVTALLTQPAPTISSRGVRARGLDAVFERGLHTDPAQRFSSACAFVDALEAALRAPVPAKLCPSKLRARSGLGLETGSSPSAVRSIWKFGVRRVAACVVAAAYFISMYA